MRAGLSVGDAVLHRGLRIPGLRKGDDSPLRTSYRRSVPRTYPSRQLPTQRIRPCGLSGTFQIQSQPCAYESSTRSGNSCRDVRIAEHVLWFGDEETYDAVVLAEMRCSGNARERIGRGVSQS